MDTVWSQLIFYCGIFINAVVSLFVYPSFLLLADGEDSTVSIQIKLENEGSDEELETDMLYSPQLALKLALTEWLGEFCIPHQYNSKSVPITVSYPYANGFTGSDTWIYLTVLGSLKWSFYDWRTWYSAAQFCLSGRQVPQSGVKSTAIDVSSMTAPSLCSSTTVTTVFQQPIMSPAMPPLCLDPLSHPMAKRPQEEEEVRFFR